MKTEAIRRLEKVAFPGARLTLCPISWPYVHSEDFR